ncbi:MAG: hypothetical protein ABS57_17060 [Mesorhizobium sp. SCN 65-12]|nr:MAG: hypothetical protein ABS57_17060 [Mesorhizobium sp. SCN 65-12]
MMPIAGHAYVAAALTLYTALPDTPNRASAYDRNVARALFERGVPLQVLESALLLGSVRRRNRPDGALPLSPVRSLAYFSSIIDEILQQPLPAGYRDYLRTKAAQVLRPCVQKSTFLDDR